MENKIKELEKENAKLVEENKFLNVVKIGLTKELKNEIKRNIQLEKELKECKK